MKGFRPRMPRFISLSMVLVLAFVAALTVRAQNITGSMAGRVIDPQASSVPGAKVTLTAPSKNLTLTTKTDDSGDFLFPGLQPGVYSLSIEAAGFKKLQDRSIPLDANDRLTLGNITLEVGSLTESVEISADVALLSTESAERGGVLVARQIENIMVNGRNPLAMVGLVPGVVSTANFQVGGASGIG